MKMKLTTITRLAACSAAGLLAAGSAFGQGTNVFNRYDVASDMTSWIIWNGWGLQGWPLTFDSTRDAGNDPSSGSMRYEIPFTGASGDQIMTFGTIANRWGWDGGTVMDVSAYTNFTVSVRVDTGSYPRANGTDYGWLEVGFVKQGWGTIGVGGQAIPLTASNAWRTLNYTINPATADLDKVVGFFLKMWSGGSHTNSLILNFDNVGIQKPEVVIPPPPPTLTLQKSTPGLAFVAASGGQYDRQNIRTVASNYSWIGASGPVSYSIDVAQHAPKTYNGFQLHMYLVPGDSDLTRPDCDWHEKHVVMWRIVNNADGSAWSDLNYKTNAPESNGIMYGGGGGLGGVGNATPTGVWTLTFNQNTNLTITTPGGGSFTTNFPPGVIEQFSENPHMQIAVGAVPGDPARIGQKVVLNGVSITGTPGQPNVHSSFVGQALDTNIWFINASSATFGVQQIDASTPYWLTWSLPATGFSPQIGDKAQGGTWSNPTFTGYNGGGKYNVLLKQTDLPAGNMGVVRMMKRVGTKLQILLPGETAAPGTPTGKTGTPLAQTNGMAFDITVNLVDNDWYPVTAPNDLIHLTAVSAQPGGYAEVGPDSILLSGTRTFTVTCWVTDSYTITASDVTNPAITSGSATVVSQ